MLEVLAFDISTRKPVQGAEVSIYLINVVMVSSGEDLEGDDDKVFIEQERKDKIRELEKLKKIDTSRYDRKPLGPCLHQHQSLPVVQIVRLYVALQPQQGGLPILPHLTIRRVCAIQKLALNRHFYLAPTIRILYNDPT